MAKKVTKKSKIASNNPIPVKDRIIKKKRSVIPSLVNQLSPLVSNGNENKKLKKPTAAYLKKQKQRLLDLRDTLVDQMNGVARDSLGRGDNAYSDSSAFGMHQADAGSDSYDRDFALNILSKEQNALNDIEDALLRIESGEYGICQGSGNIIPQSRLDAMPFARCTVEYQEQLDKKKETISNVEPVTSIFDLDDKDETISNEENIEN